MAAGISNRRSAGSDGAILTSVAMQNAFTNTVNNIDIGSITQAIHGFFAEVLQSLNSIFTRNASGVSRTEAILQSNVTTDPQGSIIATQVANYTPHHSSGGLTFEGDSIARQLGVGANNNGVDGRRLSQAGTPEFSRGDTVVTSFGTNDAGFLIGSSDARIEAWANQYGDYVASIQANGGNPMVLDIRHATGAYTGNMAVWGQAGYVGRHNATVDRMNEALEREMESRGIPFIETNGRVEISGDNLHPSAQGAQQIRNLIEQAEQQLSANPVFASAGPNPSGPVGG